MRRLGTCAAPTFEILVWSDAIKGVVGSEVVVSVREDVDQGVEVVPARHQTEI